MPLVTLAADSTTLVLNGFAIVDFAEGDILELNPANPRTSHVNGANGAVNINKRNDGGVMDLIIRVQKFSASDVFLNSQNNQVDPVVFNGSAREDFVKDGTPGVESYILENGSITTQPSNVKNNTDGNAMVEYTIRFRNVTRNL